MLRPVHLAAVLLGALALCASPAEAACAGDATWTVGTFTLAEELRPHLEAPHAPLHEHFAVDPSRAPDSRIDLDEADDADEQTCARRRHRRHDRPREARRARPAPRTTPKPALRRAARRPWPTPLVARRATILAPVATPRILAAEGARPP